MSRRLEKMLLLLAMCVGALLMWTAVPALWLWIAGRYAHVSRSDMSSFALLLTGMPATMIATGFGLLRIDRRYAARFATASDTRVVGAKWLHSLRGGSDSEPATTLDKILIINVALAVIAVTVSFALFSHGSQTLRN